MQSSTEPTPVKYFIAILRAEGVSPLSEPLLTQLQNNWGPLDYQGPCHPFDQTNYYETEMGSNLHRQIISFQDLRTPEELASAKVKCIEIEKAFAFPSPLEGEGLGVRGCNRPASYGVSRPDVKGHRTINLDIGYLDHNKIILASIKGLSQKIYLSQGVYADLVARYSHGRYQPFEWTFPDFKSGRYNADLAHLRQRYLEQLKHFRS